MCDKSGRERSEGRGKNKKDRTVLEAAEAATDVLTSLSALELMPAKHNPWGRDQKKKKKREGGAKGGGEKERDRKREGRKEGREKRGLVGCRTQGRPYLPTPPSGGWQMRSQAAQQGGKNRNFTTKFWGKGKRTTLLHTWRHRHVEGGKGVPGTCIY